jgi:DNA segregation ATPase FtsK/SpoIIIE, S-DNA-T family
LAETTAQVRGVARFSEAVSRGLRESAVIALVVLGIVLFAALASYSADDPSFFYVGNASTVHNRIGPIGAWVADVLFSLFGRPAFLFPIVIGAAGWTLFRHRKAEHRSRANTLVRLGGFVLLLIASCALATLHWDPGQLRQSAGGIVGSLVGQNLASGLNFLGATLLMMAAWMAGVSLAFGVSWLTIMDRIGRGAWEAVAWGRARLSASRNVAEGR